MHGSNKINIKVKLHADDHHRESSISSRANAAFYLLYYIICPDR